MSLRASHRSASRYRFSSWLLAWSAWAAGCAFAAPCVAPQLLSPPPGSVVPEARPFIAVRPTQPGTTPNVFAEVRVPEKGILRRFEAKMSSNILQLPLDEPIYRANVQVRLTAPCPGGAGETASTSARIYIDTGLACAAPMNVSMSGNRVAWTHAQGSGATEIAFFDAATARQLRRESIAASSPATVERVAGEAVAALRSRCGAAYSAPAFVYGN